MDHEIDKYIYHSIFSEPDPSRESTPPSSSSTARLVPPSTTPGARTSSGNYQSQVPMPTLYNGSDGSSNNAGTSDNKGVKTIEVLLYNMASMLAGVAVGYDVRLSNVSPIHPKLYPKRLANFQFHEKLLFFSP